MDNAIAPKAPWHLWVIGIVSLLWHAGGAYDYWMSKAEDRDYLASMMEPAGVSVDGAIAYMNAMPLWANIGWGLGVWGAVAGSILLLLRQRYALHAFLASLAGQVLGIIHQISRPIPGMSDATAPVVFTLVIVATTLLLAWYARRMADAGVLR